MFCENCGATLGTGKFCDSCGAANPNAGAGGVPNLGSVRLAGGGGSTIRIGGMELNPSLIFIGLSALTLIMFFLPFMTASATIFGTTIRESVGGFRMAFGPEGDSANVDLIFCLLITIAIPLVFVLKDALKLDVAKQYLAAAGLSGLGLLMLIIFAIRADTGNILGVRVSLGAGWIIALILYIAATGLAVFCVMESKKR